MSAAVMTFGRREAALAASNSVFLAFLLGLEGGVGIEAVAWRSGEGEWEGEDGEEGVLEVFRALRELV